MKAGDSAVRGARRDDGWDEAVLVWNGTVARIAEPDLELPSRVANGRRELRDSVVNEERRSPEPAPGESRRSDRQSRQPHRLRAT